MEEYKFKIANIVFALRSEKSQGNFSIEASYRKFNTREEPDIILNTHCGRVQKLDDWELIFDTGDVWRLYRKGAKWAIGLYFPVSDPDPYQVTVMEDNFRSGDIYNSIDYLNSKINRFPFQYPLSLVLAINLLARSRGVLLHACAVIARGEGLVFAGTSGAGKSTLAKIWEADPEVEILTDDRVIVREHRGQFWMYGTPWHSDAFASSPGEAPVSRLYILKHSPENSIQTVKVLKANTDLFVRSFPSFWYSQGMVYSLDFIDRLVQEVPCYQLGFVPDSSVVDFVRCQISN